MNTWPNDADGDALRRIEIDGFDFDKPCLIDFNVDFERWPPSADALHLLVQRFPEAEFHEFPGSEGGYVQFQVREKLSYRLVTATQEEITALLAEHGGVCESWGVLTG